jgi:hypothetical protein
MPLSVAGVLYGRLRFLPPAGVRIVCSPASEASVGGGGIGRSGPMTEGAERSEEGEAPSTADLPIR